jgi:hypothetical protein
MSGISVIFNLILMFFSISSLRTFVRVAQQQLEERHHRPQLPERPITPTLSPFVSPANTPQVTPRTRRRAEIRARNPPESPRRRRVPQAPAQQRRMPRQHHPRRNIARQPLDPDAGDVVHSLHRAFNVAYVQLHQSISSFL